jgi:hypothetical protein
MHVENLKIVAYTSCSVNYLAKARVFAKSLKSHAPSAIVVLCLNDVLPVWFNVDDEPFDLVLDPFSYGLPDTEQWIFKHNVMELCTAVKGMALEYLLNTYEADLFFYFDPDCYILHDPRCIADYLGDAGVGLTPHILVPETSEAGIVKTEISLLRHGLYNLGFLAVRPDEQGRTFAAWWRERLNNYCYIDYENGLFTDQRWMDLAPVVFPFVKVLRQPNLNVASWNISNRPIRILPDDTFEVDGLPLIFYHFSGVNDQQTHRHIRQMFAAGSSAATEIERRYEAEITQHGQQQLARHPWAYNYYSNGQNIDDTQRKLYRSSPDLMQAFSHPFQAQGYYNWLREHGHLDKSSLNKTRRKSIDDTMRHLVSEKFYFTQYPDAQQAVEAGIFADALAHYTQVGWLEGKNPNIFFDTTFYWSEVKDLDIYILEDEQLRRNPLQHYLEVGLVRGYRPSPMFNNQWYETVNLDVKKAIEQGYFYCGFEHYVLHGAGEKRSPGSQFIEAEYLHANPDVSHAIQHNGLLCGYEHYMMSGRFEGRRLR